MKASKIWSKLVISSTSDDNITAKMRSTLKYISLNRFVSEGELETPGSGSDSEEWQRYGSED